MNRYTPEVEYREGFSLVFVGQRLPPHTPPARGDVSGLITRCTWLERSAPFPTPERNVLKNAVMIERRTFDAMKAPGQVKAMIANTATAVRSCRRRLPALGMVIAFWEAPGSQGLREKQSYAKITK